MATIPQQLPKHATEDHRKQAGHRKCSSDQQKSSLQFHPSVPTGGGTFLSESNNKSRAFGLRGSHRLVSKRQPFAVAAKADYERSQKQAGHRTEETRNVPTIFTMVVSGRTRLSSCTTENPTSAMSTTHLERSQSKHGHRYGSRA
jgi:hypothetical protein